MFLVAFGWDYDKDTSRWAIITEKTKCVSALEEALAARFCSGDLVFDATTRTIVNDEAWLFEWEKQDPKCYAKRALNHRASIRARVFA